MTTGHESLRRYLEQMADFFKPPMCPLERFILEYGTDYQGAKRPKGVRKHANKQCFKNATHLHLSSEMPYVEGFAIHERLIPMFHAWCINSNGEVVDPTWRWPERSVYRGVIIPHEMLLKSILTKKVYGVLDYGLIDIELIEELRSTFKCAA